MRIKLKRKEIPSHLLKYFEPVSTFKPKDLIPIPWLVGIALQKDGWWLRSAPTWVKKNALPESCKDRPTTSHEYWLMLTKSARYYYDADAVRMPSTGQNGQAVNFARTTKDHLIPNQMTTQHREDRKSTADTGGRNRRTTDTWFESLDQLIEDQRHYLAHLRHVRDNGGMLLGEDGQPLGLVFNTHGYKGAHFATFPPSMIEPLIKSSTSERGVCPRCGSSWERVIIRVGQKSGRERNRGGREDGFALPAQWEGGKNPTEIQTLGWRPTCACYDERYKTDFPKAHRARKRHQRDISGNWWKRVRIRPGSPAWPVNPATVLDPFIGSGTTCLVARELGRDSIGLDASHTYLRDHCRPRLELDRLADWHQNSIAENVPEVTLSDLPLFQNLEP